MQKWDGIVAVPDLLLPAAHVNYAQWAVVACDQYTSEPAYWEQATALVAGEPSALSLVLPEVYLTESEEQIAARVAAINRQMHTYLATGVLVSAGRCAILTRRAVPGLPDRTGLLLSIDLERYEYQPGNHAPIRASEGTVLERIPPRVRIREQAPLELPHVQLLFDDPGQTVLAPLAARCAAGAYERRYDTPLMLGGGRVAGWRIPDGDTALEGTIDALFRLPSWQAHRLLLAVGDGNHSLVTAKVCWERLREVVGPDHPARYALVELINLHDPGLVFEPIHRVLFGCPPARFLQAARDWFAEGPGRAEGPVAIGAWHIHGAGDTAPTPAAADHHSVEVVAGESSATLSFTPSPRLVVDRLQPLLDHLSAQPAVTIDYIHGEPALRALASPQATGVLLPAVAKSHFFSDLVSNGVYPRKTFSTGEAWGKRYYIEARKIR